MERNQKKCGRYIHRHVSKSMHLSMNSITSCVCLHDESGDMKATPRDPNSKHGFSNNMYSRQAALASFRLQLDHAFSLVSFSQPLFHEQSSAMQKFCCRCCKIPCLIPETEKNGKTNGD